ncbi:unnamed protein product, partial [Mesorhabditis belari]|uniref:Post-GPI attachment to proteins factor 3 n=1 Tax=Mesorhabditis belari TaxID=2138241 RepID=A0AAF3F1H0_9BILA
MSWMPRWRPSRWLPFILVVLFLARKACGSIGDSQETYFECTKRCRDLLECRGRFDTFTWGRQPCFRCKYECMWATEEDFRTRYGYTPQFHGKWPFVALQIGPIVVQEPASALFSILNLFTTWLFWVRLGAYSKLPDKHVWRGYSVVGMATWISSFAFHCVDCWITEWMDYFSAGAFIFASCAVSSIIALPELSNGRNARIWRLASPTIALIVWIRHITGMMTHFDYGYNMRVCLFASLFSSLLYGRFIFKRWQTNKRLSTGDWLLIRALILLKGSVIFELYDFPPIWWLIDGHSLFHLVTIPVPLLLHSALLKYNAEIFDGHTKAMSDAEESYEEEEYEEEEVEEEVDETPTAVEEERQAPKVNYDDGDPSLTEAEKAMLAAKKRHEEDDMAKLHDYESKRKSEREKEEEELRRMKEKQEERRMKREQEEREAEEKRRAAEERQKAEEQERRSRMEAERQKKEDEKKKKAAALMGGSFQTQGEGGRNFVIPKKASTDDKFGNIVQAKQEMGMTKDQQEDAKKNFLRYQRAEIEAMPGDKKETIKILHQRICKLEADKFDLEKRHERQEYDLKELNERQRQEQRKLLNKKGTTDDTGGRHPPKVQVASKYDRQIDRRNFKERRAMFEHKNAYPCFPGVPPPPALLEKVIKKLQYEIEKEEEEAEQAAADAEDEEEEEEEE